MKKNDMVMLERLILMAVYKNEKKSGWMIKVQNPTNKKNTTIRINPKTGLQFKTKKEAEEFEIFYIKNKINVTMTLNDLFKKYVNDYLSLRPSSSADKLKSWYKTNIKPRLGKKRIASLRLTDLENLAREMLVDDYSINYINKMTTTVKTILNYGVSHGYIEKNPVAGYKGLKVIKTSDEVKYWTPREFKQVIDSISECYPSAHTDTTYIRLMLMFAYFTGARKGELRALKWPNIEMYSNRGIIHIDYHINEKNERVRGRKNGNGYTLHMDRLTLQIVREIYNHFSKYDGFDPRGYVFPSIGKGFDHPIGGHTPTRWVQELAEYNGLQNITFHGLRHSTVCYLATEIGLTPYQVADRIGDTVGVVLQHYYQFFQESRVEVADMIGSHKNEYFEALVNTNQDNPDHDNGAKT